MKRTSLVFLCLSMSFAGSAYAAGTEAAIPCGATSATLTGQTTGGQAFAGTDSVKTICK